MLGLTAAAQFCVSGASQILVADLDSNRLGLARSFGATHCVDSGDRDSLLAELESVTKGRGVDVAVDFAGVLPAVETALASVRIGGSVLLAGSVFPLSELKISPETIVRKMLTIRGLHNYGPSDLKQALRFLEDNHSRFPFHKLVSQSFPLEQTSIAFEAASDQRPIRIAVRQEGAK